MSSNSNTATSLPPGRAPRPEPPRLQYLELKANVHRKLLNRLNLEALANAERSRAESEIRSLLFELIAEESMAHGHDRNNRLASACRRIPSLADKTDQRRKLLSIIRRRSCIVEDIS